MSFLRELKFQRDTLIKNKEYLNKGNYILHQNLRTYLLSGEIGKGASFPFGERGMKNVVKGLIARLFYSVKVKEDGNKFLAQAVYFSNLPDEFNRDIKFFDYRSQRILTVCQNEVRFQLYFKNRKYFEEYFQMPKLLWYNETERIFAEELIPKKRIPGPEWGNVLTGIFDCYLNYYRSVGADQISCRPSDMLQPGLEKILSEIALYRQHGDLSSDNFIYSENRDVYFIDFDHADDYPYYYDPLFLIVHLDFYEGNAIGMDLFLSGAFDAYFYDVMPASQNPVYDCFAAFTDFFWRKRIKDYVSERQKAEYRNYLQCILDKLKG